MAMTHWDPFEGLTPLRDIMNQMLEEGVVRPMRFGLMARTFPIDVFEAEGEFVIEAMLPGIKPDTIQVSAVRDRVTIHVAIKPAEHTAKNGAKTGYYLRRERFEGEMTRVIDLPFDIDAEHVSAGYEHGVLTLHAPKAEQAKPRQITIDVKEPTALK